MSAVEGMRCWASGSGTSTFSMTGSIDRERSAFDDILSFRCARLATRDECPRYLGTLVQSHHKLSLVGCPARPNALLEHCCLVGLSSFSMQRCQMILPSKSATAEGDKARYAEHHFEHFNHSQAKTNGQIELLNGN
ncbi:hypothetical protein [Rhizobium sp. WYJ-E13]|uniref:hypothetical protein n=1 Tax=Rhizobium sp. WYJ-E13 TaxID=2849093 RepID=UPI001C1ECFB4|nr:hypothetical protein [Rhizobium sp. WYJ-E13]QWW72561.1 hypothetical protein KQ933_32140 [Rhizobium sp. WYJ-E13]